MNFDGPLKNYHTAVSYFASALTFLASLLFKLAALFLWIVPRFANLSIIEAISGNLPVASFLSSNAS